MNDIPGAVKFLYDSQSLVLVISNTVDIPNKDYEILTNLISFIVL